MQFITRAELGRVLDMIETITQHQSVLFRQHVNLAAMHGATWKALQAQHEGLDPLEAYEHACEDFRRRRPADFDPVIWGLKPRGGA